MAAVDTGNNPNDPNNPNTQPGNVNQPGQTSQPATTSGAGGVTATGAGNVTGQVTGTANPSQPFQNIASYLSANAPGGQQLASQVAGQVSTPINEAQTGITNASQDFTKSVNAGYTPENKDLISAVSQNPAYVVGENPENVTNFQAQLNDVYKGPSDFTQAPGYADLQAKIASAQSAANNTSSESGIQSLLKGVEGPTTAGINKLDSLLLSADPSNYKTIQNAGAGAAALPGALTQATTDQNALAATGATNASKTAANALAALNAAHGNVTTNLADEQNTIQGIVNEYNQSVGVINPVVQDITAAIQNFLAQNPNVTFPAGTDPMAALENIASIVMPEEANYASPQDYANIAALIQLGDQNTGNFAVQPGTASQAQTFQVPGQLMDAVGKAPGVEQALQQELEGFGNQINSAVTPFTDAQTAAFNYNTYGLPAAQAASADQKTITGIQTQLAQLKGQRGVTPESIKALEDKLAATQADMTKQQATAAQYPQASWDSVGSIAQGLQWVDPAETNYRALIDSINASLGKLGSVGVPSLTYGPNTVTDPVTGIPIGTQVGKDVKNSVLEAAPGALGAGAADAYAAAVAAGAIPTTASTVAAGTADAIAGEAPTVGSQLSAAGSAGGLGAVQALGPAALSAYGTSNIITNAKKDPIKAGLGTLANTGISLATLSIPPRIFTSIGKDISRVVKNIGNWFGGLF